MRGADPNTAREMTAARDLSRIGLAVLVLVVLALTVVQGRYTWLTFSRVLYEELAESVRNPVWLAHGLAFDGMSSNVGWYALVAAGYELFGFSFALAKIIRLVLHLLALGALADVLRHFVGWRAAVLPLATIGLSPAILSFNTLATTHSIDLQWAPIICWLIWRIASSRSGVGMHVLLGIVVGWSCLMWPGCVMYLPVWVGSYAVVTRVTDAGRVRRRPVGAAVLAFVGTALAPMVFLENPGTWLHDPVAGSGAFRGGAGAVVGSSRGLAANVARVFLDLTREGGSYYFWLPRPDLSGIFGGASTATLVLTLAVWARGTRRRTALLGLLFTGGGAVLLASSAGGPAGLRRATLALAVFYALFVCGWSEALVRAGRGRTGAEKTYARLSVLGLSLLLVHHVLALGPNADALQGHPPDADRAWFAAAASPDAAAARWADHVDAGGVLDCREITLVADRCRYAEIYAAVVAELRWNRGRNEPRVQAYDPTAARTVTLTPETWPPGVR